MISEACSAIRRIHLASDRLPGAGLPPTISGKRKHRHRYLTTTCSSYEYLLSNYESRKVGERLSTPDHHSSSIPSFLPGLPVSGGGI